MHNRLSRLLWNFFKLHVMITTGGRSCYEKNKKLWQFILFVSLPRPYRIASQGYDIFGNFFKMPASKNFKIFKDLLHLRCHTQTVEIDDGSSIKKDNVVRNKLLSRLNIPNCESKIVFDGHLRLKLVLLDDKIKWIWFWRHGFCVIRAVSLKKDVALRP